MADIRRSWGVNPFTFAEVRSQGISETRLRAAVRAGQVIRLRHGVYAIKALHDTPEPAPSPSIDPAHLKAEIEDLRTRGHHPIVAGLTAAALWRIPTASEFGAPAPAPATLIVPRSPHLHRGRRGQVLLRMSTVPEEHVTRLDGMAITTPLRTGVDVARLVAQSPRTALIPLVGAARAHIREILESGASEHDITIAGRDRELQQRIQRDIDHIVARSPRRGIRHVRLVRSLVDPRLETPLEAISWEQISTWRLPAMTPQADVRGASGRLYRADFLIDRVIGESDGAVKYLDGQAIMAERQRQADLERAGFVVVRWTWEEMWRQPWIVRQRLENALTQSHNPTATATQIWGYSAI